MPDDSLIPPPPVVRAELAKNIRQCRLLRSLYRLSVRASEAGSAKPACNTDRTDHLVSPPSRGGDE